MSSASEKSKVAAHPPAKQRRGKRTQDSLIETGLRMLMERDFDAMPVAEIVKEAGSSVGSFYARFQSKEAFHHALVERYARDRVQSIEQFFATVEDGALLDRWFEIQISRVGAYRRFWNANLQRSIQDPNYWEPFRAIVRRIGDLFVERAARRAGRPLTQDEETDVRYAIQVVNGVINNTMINRPGPVNIEDPEFHGRLVRTFVMVSGWDRLA